MIHCSKCLKPRALLVWVSDDKRSAQLRCLACGEMYLAEWVRPYEEPTKELGTSLGLDDETIRPSERIPFDEAPDRGSFKMPGFEDVTSVAFHHMSLNLNCRCGDLDIVEGDGWIDKLLHDIHTQANSLRVWNNKKRNERSLEK